MAGFKKVDMKGVRDSLKELGDIMNSPEAELAQVLFEFRFAKEKANVLRTVQAEGIQNPTDKELKQIFLCELENNNRMKRFYLEMMKEERAPKKSSSDSDVEEDKESSSESSDEEDEKSNQKSKKAPVVKKKLIVKKTRMVKKNTKAKKGK